jgi:hypothetical protein
MNYVILFGIALFFIAMSVRDGGSGGFIFRDGQLNARIVADDYTLRVNGTGNIDLAPDASGVTALSRRGSLDVHLRRDGAERRVLYTNDDGAVRRQFFVAGSEQAWGPEADRFVAEAMPIVLRETALDAEERVAWLLENRGQGGLLDEIELIDSDFAQRVFSIEYAKAAAIAPADFDRLMRLAKDNLSSDFELRLTLTGLYNEQMPTGEQLVSLLTAGTSLDSDFEARVLLQHVLGRLPATPEAVAAYLDVVATIDSDFEMRLALAPLVTRVELADDLVARSIEVAGRELNSDFELRVLLAAAASRVGTSDALARAYTSAAASINSDFEHRLALHALAAGAKLSPYGWQLLLESAQEIGSDFECATLLQTVAPQLPRDEAVVAAYRATLNTIESDFEQQRAAAALLTAGLL